MPKPFVFKDGYQSFTQATFVIGQRPDCAILIGLIASEWALLEAEFVHFFSIVTSEVKEQVPGQYSFVANPLARTIFSTLDSNSARQGIVRAECKKRLSKELNGEYGKVEDSIKNCRKSRNVALHSLWGITDEFPNDLIRTNKEPEYERFETSDFEATLNTINQAVFKLHEFQIKCEAFLIAQKKGTR